MKMAVQLTNYKQRVEFLDQTFTAQSIPVTIENNSSRDFDEVSSEALADQETNGLISSRQTTSELRSHDPYVSIFEASCSWNQVALSKTLSNITLQARKGDMIAITGAVGSGKSSLLTSIIGELPLSKGEISYHGKVAYFLKYPGYFLGL